MKYFALTVSLVVLLSPQAFSQSRSEQPAVSPCTLTVTQSPAIRGVKLGMSAQELFTLFPGSAEHDEIKSAMAKADDYPQFGVVPISFAISQYANNDRFAGIDYVQSYLFDGRVARFSVQYSGLPEGPQWMNADDFITKLGESLKLPAAKDWAAYQGGKNVKCNGFEMRVTTPNQASLSVMTSELFEKQGQRRKAYEEKKRREFKP
ncbi:MAG: hypothetical protein M3R68_10945 [Acidobacteriota bacterium]|nr:hypothetical protein [Acidobacteriota bacterium]